MKFFSLLISVFLLYTLQWTTFVEARSPLKIRTKIPLDISDIYNIEVSLKNCRYRYWTEKPVIFCDMDEKRFKDYYIAFSVTERPENDNCKITDKSSLIAYKLHIGGKEATDIAYTPFFNMIKNESIIYPRKGRGVLYVRDANQQCRFALTYSRVHVKKYN